ncbi:MAG: hypothetical protein DRO11_04645 [Methanobacteriota archaeon]|nr:MAG: hypothetical protein DRO11_04645 [Euryarchaeota archaeon]
MGINDKLYEEGFERFPLQWVVGQNLLLIIYFFIGFMGMYPLKVYGFPIVSVLFIVYMAVMLVSLLRKHLCTNCYYYGKMCHVGWGKLSSGLFKPHSGSYSLGGKLGNITWVVATIVPIVAVSVVVIRRWFSTFHVILLLFLVVLSCTNFFIQRKSCENCKMRFICPGSMVKGDKLWK